MFTLKWVKEIFNNKVLDGDEKIEIKGVVTDSRDVQEGDLFIPLVGENFDAHDFLSDVSERATAMLSHKEISHDSRTVQVDDTLTALQILANKFRLKINPIVIGITGSNGKTSTKDMLESVLKQSYQTHATKGNFNNHIGLPLTILTMPETTEVLILEMGMSHFGEIKRLSQIAKPDHAIITNIGESHIENLGSREGIAQAKLEVLKGLQKGLLVIDGDEELFDHVFYEGQIRSCGFSRKSDVTIEHVHVTLEGTRFECDQEMFKTNLVGNHHAKNASYAITLAKHLKLPLDSIKRGLEQVELSEMRFERHKAYTKAELINDAYNASPTSMRAAIEIVKELEGYQRKVLVLGDMLELGSNLSVYYDFVKEVIDDKIDLLYTYGETSSKLHTNKINEQHFKCKKGLIEALKTNTKEGDLVLFKASRGMKLEEVINELLKNN